MYDVIYLRVTDTALDGSATSTIHSVKADWKQPEVVHTERYEPVTEAQARIENPALFGISPPITGENIDKQIAELQALSNPQK